MARFFEGYPWRFVVTNLDMEVMTFLDGLASNREISYALNEPWVARMDVPSDDPEVNLLPAANADPFVAMNSRLLFGFRREAANVLAPKWVCRYSGILMQPNDEITPQVDVPTTHLTALDAWQYLMSRPVMDSALAGGTNGALPGQKGVTYGNGILPQAIILDLLTNSLIAGPISGKTGPDNLYLNFGQAPYGAFYNGNLGGAISGMEPINGITFQRGLSLGEALQQLTQTGACDIVLLPQWDPVNQPGLIAQVYTFPLAGWTYASLTGGAPSHSAVKPSAVFAWDQPGRSLNGLNRLQDGAAMGNVIQGYIDQGGLITVPQQSDPAGQAKYGAYWLQKFYSGQNISQEAVELLALTALKLRQRGKRTVTMSVAPEFGPVLFQDYFLGDQVLMWATRAFRQAIKPRLTTMGWQDPFRVYGIPLAIPDDSVETVTDLLLASPFEEELSA